ncbi:glycosyltransferase [Xylophilus sp. GW821-FHT01B05]
MRVLHVGKFFPPHVGGMEVFLADLIREQRSQGIDAYALVHGDPQPEDPAWLVRVPVQAHLVYAPIAAGFPVALHRAIRHFKPEVLHLHMPNNAVFWALLMPIASKIPWVVHWHSDVVVSRIRSVIGVAYKLYRPFERAVLDRAQRIIATSPPYLEHSQPLAPWRSKCAVIPLGLATTSIATSRPDGSSTSFTWRPGRFRVLSIGRLTYYKGFEVLIRAMREIPDAELLIVGEGELRASLAALIQQETPVGQKPNVRLLGLVTDAEKNTLLNDCELFCLASRERTEAFGMVLLEAMAHAKPCIVSDLPGSGMPWLVAQAKVGLRVAVEDVQQWRKAIQQLQKHPAQRQEFGQNGRDALYQRFSIAANAHAMAAIYAQIAPRTNSAPTHNGVLVVIPAKDEAATVGTVVAELRAAGWQDVLVVDDHSTDGTGDIARAAGARVLRPVLPVGAWGGMQTGIRYGVRHGFAAVVTMDADGQHEVDQLPALLACRDTADMVIGAFPERASRLRKWAWSWFRRLAGFELRDLTSGFRYYNRDAMRLLASGDATLLDYQDLGALLMVVQAGLRIKEVQVAMRARTSGRSRIFRSWFGVARYMALTTLLCLSRRSLREQARVPRQAA